MGESPHPSELVALQPPDQGLHFWRDNENRERAVAPLRDDAVVAAFCAGTLTGAG
jgi:hypothetical protein